MTTCVNRDDPLDHVDIVENKRKTDFPHYTVTTEEDIANIFQVGDSVLGYTSNAEGTIVSRNLDLGQLVIKITNNVSFQVGELLKLVGSPNQVVLSGASPEYLVGLDTIYRMTKLSLMLKT